MQTELIDHSLCSLQEGVVAFTQQRDNAAPAGDKWGSRFLMAAGGALGVVLAFAVVRL